MTNYDTNESIEIENEEIEKVKKLQVSGPDSEDVG